MVTVPIVSLAGSAAGYLVAPASANRNIGGIIADVTVEEVGTDEVVTTDHPVEQGAEITDHAYKKAAQLIVRAGWSNSAGSTLDPLSVLGVSGTLSALSGQNRVNDIYSQLLTLQASKQLISVVTGKRTYQNMLITSVSQDTDVKTENALIAVVRLKEIIIVSTQTVTIGSSANMQNPQLTGETQNSGTQQLQAAPNFNASAAGLS